MLPFLEVSHLPSSSSFYSAAAQPLGLRFISAGNTSGSPSLTYGLLSSPPVPVFELRQVKPTTGRPLKLSRLVFSAASPEAVRDFQALARRVKEETRRSAQFGDQGLLRYPAEPEESPSGTAAGKARTGVESAKLPDKARETDIDGNIMEVAYVSPTEYPERYSGSTTRRSQSTQSEASRILVWNYDVASSEPVSGVSLAPLAPASSSLVSPRRPGRSMDEEQASVPRRGATHASGTLYEVTDPTLSPRQNSSSFLGPGTMVGALMGAAIGAGLTYGVMRGNSQEPEVTVFQRSTVYPEPHHDSRGRYSEYDRPVKEVQYRDEYTSVADRRPPPTILTRYTHAPAPVSRSREVDDAYEGRSRQLSRSKSSGSTSVRARSEVSTGRKPLMVTDVEHRSYVSPKHGEPEDVAQDHRGHAMSRHPSRSKHSGAEPCSIRRSHTYHIGADGDSYISARSQRTSGTVRALPAPGAQAELASRPAPKTTGRVSAGTLQDKPRRSNSYASARDVPLPVSRAANYVPAREAPLPANRPGMSYVPARHVPLPSSGLGGGGLRTEQWDDDLDTIAPSDSISCVGSRRSERPYR